MKKLIKGIVQFQNSLTEEGRAIFAKLAMGQSPDALFITCSDSRVVPDLFASTDPGDLFVLRNVGNLVPLHTENLRDTSVVAGLEYSINSLHVSDIIVCGHSECGAMKAIHEGIEHVGCPHLTTWLKYGEKANAKVKKGRVLNPSASVIDQISQLNVLEQMENLMSYPVVKEKVKAKSLRIHGWWFDIAKAGVYCYEPSHDQFVLINEKEANLILERLKNH